MGDACTACGGRGEIWDRKTSTNKTCYKCQGRGAPDPHNPYPRSGSARRDHGE